MKRTQLFGALALTFAGLCPLSVFAQKVEAEAGINVQARGPVHEAIAQPFEAVVSTETVIKQKPPEPIAEVPADQRPAGANVHWIPGYWQWDSDRNNYLWVTGAWRNMPEGRHWVVGYWAPVQGGYYWVSGHWAAQQEQDFQFVSQRPPAPREEAMSNPPDDHSFYIPGSWFLASEGYQWRPGYWTEMQEGRVWQPARYQWTPQGYVFTSGYWDAALNQRGMLFAPVSFDQPLWNNQSWVYQPQYVINPLTLMSSLFLNTALGHYYYGDYYGNTYANAGFQPWYGARTYDPLFAYERWAHRSDAQWLTTLKTNFAARQSGQMPPPPRTLADQLKLNTQGTANTQAAVVALAQLNNQVKVPNLKLEPVTAQQRSEMILKAREMHKASVDFGRGVNIRGGANSSTSLKPGANVPAVPGNVVPKTPATELPKVPGNVIPKVPGTEVPKTPGNVVPKVPGNVIPKEPPVKVDPKLPIPKLPQPPKGGKPDKPDKL
jgi:WXXGXW repeat (2 copies)